MMEKIIDYTLILHVVSGAVALLSGIVAIVTKKGSKNHTLSGNIYFYGMLSVVITGFFVAISRNNIFLQTIAIFSFYLAFTGKRVLRNKKEVLTSPVDWGFNIFSMITGFIMVYLGVFNLLRIGFAGAVPMLLVFGGLLSWMTVEDFIKMWKKKFVKNDWLYTHIGRMGGSFIATSTAFLLTNIRIEPIWIVWLAPTIIGTPLMTMATIKWKKKMGDRPKNKT